MYQDITVISKFDSQNWSDEEEPDSKVNDERSRRFLEEVHLVAVDSMHTSKRLNSLYKDIVEEKVNALLMDDEQVKFM